MTPARWLGSPRIDLVDCGSTNDEAARLARAGARHGTIVVAGSQRAGRGRDGRVWASPAGVGLYLSAVIRPPLPLELVPPMTLAIGIGLCDAIRTYGADAQLKWPNDVLVGGRKLAGVLVESQSQGGKLEAAVVGIGVNLGGAHDPIVPLPEIAITIAEAAGHVVDRDSFLHTLLGHVEHWIDRYVASGPPAVNAAWQERMVKHLIARSEQIVGEVAGLDGDGALLLRDDAGQLHRVRSGDVVAVSCYD